MITVVGISFAWDGTGKGNRLKSGWHKRTEEETAALVIGPLVVGFEWYREKVL